MSEPDDSEAVPGELVAAPTRAELALAAPLPPDENPARVYLASLRSRESQRVMELALVSIADTICPGATPDTLAWHRLRYRDGMALRAALSQKHAPRTVNRMLSALRSVIEHAINLGHMTDAEGGWRSRLHGVAVDKDALAGRALDADEVQRLVASCPLDTLRGARDAALLALLFGAGLRRREAAGASVSAYNAAQRRITVVGKGAKRRTVRLADDAADLVDRYLALRGEVPGPLLVSFSLHGELREENGVPTGLTETGVYEVVDVIAKRAGVSDFRPHDARRTRITEMISQGESLAAVKRVAGHESSATTDRYDRSKDDLAYAAAARVPMLGPKP